MLASVNETSVCVCVCVCVITVYNKAQAQNSEFKLFMLRHA